jgi:hypothetical protein
VQWNDGGSFGADANLTYDGSTLTAKAALTVGVNDTGHDVIFYGATADTSYFWWDESDDRMVVSGKVEFVGDGAWKTWTPTWGNVSIGNATVTAQYVQLDEWVFVKLKATAGSSTSYSSGSMTISLPVATNGDTGYQWLTCALAPAGGTLYEGPVLTSGSTAYPCTEVASGTYASLTNANGGTSVPAGWGTSAIIYMNGWYRAA